MDSANPVVPSTSSTSSTQPAPPPASQGAQQQAYPPHYPPGQPSQYFGQAGANPTSSNNSPSTFHLPQPPSQQQQQPRPVYPYPTGFSHQGPSPGANPGAAGAAPQSLAYQQHYAPYPYHQLPNAHHFQPYQPYNGYPPPQQHYAPHPQNPHAFASHHPAYPQFSQQQQYQQVYRPPPVPQQQRGLSDPSASAAAAALVGLPQNPSASSSGSQNPSAPPPSAHANGGGGPGLDSFGLPIPPAHYSSQAAAASSSAAAAAAASAASNHARAHSYPHAHLHPLAHNPPHHQQQHVLPHPPQHALPNPLAHHSVHPQQPTHRLGPPSVLLPAPSGPSHHHSVPSPFPPHATTDPSSSSTTAGAAKPSKPPPAAASATTKAGGAGGSKAKPAPPAAAEPEVVPAVLTRERRNPHRPRTSYKPAYDSDFSQDDDDDDSSAAGEGDDDARDGGAFEDEQGGGSDTGAGRGRGGRRNTRQPGASTTTSARKSTAASAAKSTTTAMGRGRGAGRKGAAGASQEGDASGHPQNEGEYAGLEHPSQQQQQQVGENTTKPLAAQGGGAAAAPGRGKKRARTVDENDGEDAGRDEYEYGGYEDEADAGGEFYEEYDDGDDFDDDDDDDDNDKVAGRARRTSTKNGGGGGSGGGGPGGKSSRGGWGGAAGTRPETFLTKLWKMLHGDPVDVQQYLRWDKTGRLLLIPDEKEFVERVCKVHFSQKSITSFNKQMNNWDFKRHSRSQRDLTKLKKHNPTITRETRIWYHTSLHSRSTWDDVARVTRHEDGMAKKRRVRSKRTGVVEEAAPRKGRPKGSGGPLKIPGMLSSESEGEGPEDGGDDGPARADSIDDDAGAETLPTKGSRSRGGAKGKGKGVVRHRDEIDEDVKAQEQDHLPSPPANKRKVGPAASGSNAETVDGGSASNPEEAGPSASTSKAAPPEDEVTDVDAPGEVDDDAGANEVRDPTSKDGRVDDDQDAEGVDDDDDTEMGDGSKKAAEKSTEAQIPVVAKGRQTRASRGLRGVESPAPTPPKPARGRGKKANNGVSKAGDEVTSEKKEAVQGGAEEGNGQEPTREAGEEDTQPSTDVAAEAIEIIRQEAPKPKSRGGGWYLPARVAEARKKQQAEEAAAEAAIAAAAGLHPSQSSEEMRRGGAGGSVFALPRPPHLSNVPDQTASSSLQELPARSASQPPQTESTDSATSTSHAASLVPATLHHPQDAPNPYFSEPGHERPRYYSTQDGLAGLRPFVHPAHAIAAEAFVPGIESSETNQAEVPVTRYPVPVAEAADPGRSGESPRDATERNEAEEEETPSAGREEDVTAHEDFEAQYAKLEALVAGDGEGTGDEGEGGPVRKDDEDEDRDGPYEHQSPAGHDGADES
ncbi:hypothetical protein JCM11491_000693 [Sporobolomyces phaffii]